MTYKDLGDSFQPKRTAEGIKKRVQLYLQGHSESDSLVMRAKEIAAMKDQEYEEKLVKEGVDLDKFKVLTAEKD